MPWSFNPYLGGLESRWWMSDPVQAPEVCCEECGEPLSHETDTPTCPDHCDEEDK